MDRDLSDSSIVELPAPTEGYLFREITDELAERGFSLAFPVPKAGSIVHYDELFDSMLRVARVLSLNEVEWYFLEKDDVGPFSPRNELEALNLVLSTLKKCTVAEEAKGTILALIEIALKRLDISDYEDVARHNIPCNGHKERILMDWAETHGIKGKLDVAVFEGTGRGGRAIETIAAGDIVLEIPLDMTICEDTADKSDMFLHLKDIDGLTGECKTLLWSMRERHNPQSKFAPYFASLPDSFNTGLSFDYPALKILAGTTLFEELIHAKEHLQSEYSALFPNLSDRYPLVFPPEYFTWEMYLWACELWYSNGLTISFPDGATKVCLVPMAGLLNHSVYPHITRYSKIGRDQKMLTLRAARPCKAGQQCFLSYGAFPNSHLLKFYGFLLNSDNPFDTIPIDLDLSDDPNRLVLLEKLKLGAAHMIRGSWHSPSQSRPYGLPTRLLAAIHILLMEEIEVDNLSTHSRDAVIGSKNEKDVYELLLSILTNMLETLGESSSHKEDTDTLQARDITLAMEYKQSQRKLLRSACTSCMLALKDLR